MDKMEIENLFASLLEDPLEDSRAVRDVFSILVKTTLGYRDEMVASRGVTLTVGDVRTSLDWLITILKGGSIPKSDNKTSLELVQIWLEKLQAVTR